MKGHARAHLTTLCHELYNKCLAVAEMGDILATIDMGRKEGGCFAPFGGS